MGNGQMRESEVVMSAADKSLMSHLVEESDVPVTQIHTTHSESSDHTVIRQLILNCNEKLSDVIFLVKKGSNLRFVVGQSLCNLNVRLFVSHRSVRDKEEQSHYELTFHEKHASADFQATETGSYHYFFTVDGTSQPEDANGSGYFIVQPEVRVGGNLQTNVPLNGIVCQTVLSKNLGPFSGWLERLIVAKKCGYNAIHFTPLQELGDSQSAYALRDFFKLNPAFGSDVNVFDIAKLVGFLDEEWGMLSFTDLVLNHAANESEWIAENPQCVYNLVNAPHLKPAFLLDCLLARFSKEVADGLWRDCGLPPEICSEDHLQLVRHVLHERIEKLRLWEFYQVDIERMLVDTVKQSTAGVDSDTDVTSAGILTIQPDCEYRRLAATIDLQVAASMLNGNAEHDVGHQNVDVIYSRLQTLNAVVEAAVRHHLEAAINNIVHSVWQRFIDMSGEKAPAVTCSQPLMNRYFRLPADYNGACIEDDEALMHSDRAIYCWAHSGWVPEEAINPLANFAEPPSYVYLRRELNSWTDSVKLRYGSSPDDCPALWARAAKYAAETARVFHGIRLDNCHSTPLHVAEYVLSAARHVRPDLYVFAELYAGAQSAACHVANRLGLSATVEVALHTHSAWKLAELVQVAGEVPLGAFVTRQTDWLIGRRRTPSILFDQTHDDASPLQRRTYVDPLPSAAVVSAASSAVGSNRGYDELIPRTISVITETRLYRRWQSEVPTSEVDRLDGDARAMVKSGMETVVDMSVGLVAVRRALNELHVRLAVEGFDEVAADMLDEDIVMVTRRCAATQRAVVTLAHTAFHAKQSTDAQPLNAFEVPGVVSVIHLEASVVSWSSDCEDHDELIVGLSDYQVETHFDVSVADSNMVQVLHHTEATCDEVELVNFPPGSVIVLEVALTSDAVRLLDQLLQLFDTWIWNQSELSTATLDQVQKQFEHADSLSQDEAASCAAGVFLQLVMVVSSLNQDESRYVLYEVEAERQPSGDGFTVYHVPGHGNLSHCGLAGVATLLSVMRQQRVDPAKHPLGMNLLHGDWLMEYIVERLAVWPGSTRQLSDWFQQVFDFVRSLPRCLVPCYFEAIVSAVHALVNVRM